MSVLERLVQRSEGGNAGADLRTSVSEETEGGEETVEAQEGTKTAAEQARQLISGAESLPRSASPSR